MNFDISCFVDDDVLRQTELAWSLSSDAGVTVSLSLEGLFKIFREATNTILLARCVWRLWHSAASTTATNSERLFTASAVTLSSSLF